MGSTGEQDTTIGDALPSQGVSLGSSIPTRRPPSRLTARPRPSWAQLKPDAQRLLSLDHSTAWEPEIAALIDWFNRTPPPSKPFEMYRAVTILRPARYWRYFEADILAGPGKARAYTGGLQKDLRRLADLFGGPEQ